jgi:predicted nucleotidyltransferase
LKLSPQNVVDRQQNVVMAEILNIFSNKPLVDVLIHFFLHPEEEFYQAHIVKTTGHALMQIQRALKRLENAGLITKSQNGNRVYYKANRTHPAFEDIKRLLFKTVLFGDFLQSTFKPLKNKILFAFIYGSFARSEEGRGSDIDIFFIGNLSMRELSSLFGPLSRELNLEINPNIYSLEEFQAKWKDKNHFLNEVIESPKIWLIGDENALGKIIERRTAPSSQNIQRRNPQPPSSRRARSKRRLHSSAID